MGALCLQLLFALALIQGWFARETGAFADKTVKQELDSVRFLHESISEQSDIYTWTDIECGYLEGENITCAQCGWGGPCSYKFLNEPVPPQDCETAPVLPGYDRIGGDFSEFVVKQDNWETCRDACCAEAKCVSWVYIPDLPAASNPCHLHSHCCFLKYDDINPVNSSIHGIITGAAPQPHDYVRPPPLGIRSAVPLGGLGAGAIELRADGTFHEVTIQNQHPASSAKYGVLADAMLALYTQHGSDDGITTAMRTQAPDFARGVSQIGYSGSYPAARLRVLDDAVSLSPALYAYWRLVPSNEAASAQPAVMFTLTVRNSGAQQGRAALYLTMPFGAINDCSRVSAHTTIVETANHTDCLHKCGSNSSTCASWAFNGSLCWLNSDVPHSVFAEGWHCGVAGQWSASSGDLTLHATPDGDPHSAAAGNVSFFASSDGGQKPQVSFAVADDPSALYKSFEAGQGQFAAGAGVTRGPFAAQTAAHGAAAVVVDLEGYAEAALTIVFAWYFPDRDHMGVNVGNFYSTFAKSSQDFAWLATPTTLRQTVSTINSLHRVFSNEDSSLPEWLQDHMVNQLSHFRGMMYLRDGRMREYEAPDCPDVDSIHNDYQRHLPYLWLFPRFELSKIARWGEGQQPAGYLLEDLGSFGLGPLDQWADRIMADTTSLWIVEQWELYRNTNDSEYLLQNYAAVRRGIIWMIENANTYGQGLPWQLVCTYDIIDFSQYNATTFNSFVYLASLRAAERIALALNDSGFAEVCNYGFTVGQAQLYNLLWNSELGYFRAYTGGDAIMGDCLYGQMLAHHHGLGWLADVSKIQSHLEAELKYNGDAFGIKVVTGRHTPPPERLVAQAPLPEGMDPAMQTRRVQQGWPQMVKTYERLGFDTQDDVIWLGAAPDWSYMQIALNGRANLSASLAPTEAQLVHYRDSLRDLWNIVGIISPADWGEDVFYHGQPYVTSHYGFMLTDYYLLPVLSGQQTNLQKGSLEFDPVYDCPFNLPLLLANTTGLLSCTASGSFTVEIAFGHLLLPAGGLVVNGRAYPYAVNLQQGGKVSW